MKLDVVVQGGRKKDFWDLHKVLPNCTIENMLGLHQKRVPYLHNREHTLGMLTDFQEAEDGFMPDCLLRKHLEFIKKRPAR